MAFKSVTKIVEAEDKFTDKISPTWGHGDKALNISVGGSGWVAVITAQRSFNNGDTWNDCSKFTSPEEARICDSEEGVMYRIGCKEGDFTSGSIPLRLSK